jgi:transposase
MSNTSRRKFAPDFKAKVSLASVKEQQTIEEICKKYDLHPSQVNTWKKQFLSEASVVFERPAKKETDERDETDELIQKLYAKIGELNISNDFLKKKLF